MTGLQAALKQHQAKSLHRQRCVTSSAPAPQIVIDGKSYLTFCHNDYLGLSNHPDVVQALCDAARTFGAGGASSQLVAGHTRIHRQLEEELADFTGRESAVLFSTGYMANAGVVTALTGRGDAIFADRLSHASLIDAGLLSHARFSRYRHCDPEHAGTLLAAASGRRKLLVTDGVFSMDGNCAPLPALAAVAQKHNALLMVDDAHGIGVTGATGRGSTQVHHITPQALPVLTGTLSKAFGTAGAFVAGSRDLTETVIQFARSYIFTTAMPPALAAAALAALRIVREEHWRREKLQQLIHQFRAGCHHLPALTLMPSQTPVQPLLTGSVTAALHMAHVLREQGIFIRAIRPPSVPENCARLRITFSALHTSEHVEQLLQALAQAHHSLPEDHILQGNSSQGDLSDSALQDDHAREEVCA